VRLVVFWEPMEFDLVDFVKVWIARVQLWDWTLVVSNSKQPVILCANQKTTFLLYWVGKFPPRNIHKKKEIKGGTLLMVCNVGRQTLLIVRVKFLKYRMDSIVQRHRLLKLAGEEDGPGYHYKMEPNDRQTLCCRDIQSPASSLTLNPCLIQSKKGDE
jgi:hypothetical protein